MVDNGLNENFDGDFLGIADLNDVWSSTLNLGDVVYNTKFDCQLNVTNSLGIGQDGYFTSNVGFDLNDGKLFRIIASTVDY